MNTIKTAAEKLIFIYGKEKQNMKRAKYWVEIVKMMEKNTTISLL